MKKTLLTLCAMVATAFVANAQTLLYDGGAEGTPLNGFPGADGSPLKAEAKDVSSWKIADRLTVVAKHDAENTTQDYPSFFFAGDEGLNWSNPRIGAQGVSKEQSDFKTYDLYLTEANIAQLKKTGFYFSGDAVVIKSVTYNADNSGIDYTGALWIGNTQVSWGGAFGVDKAAFANVVAGQWVEIVLAMNAGKEKDNPNGNMLNGGWGGINVSVYEKSQGNTDYEYKVVAATKSITWCVTAEMAEKLKNGGLVCQGDNWTAKAVFLRSAEPTPIKNIKVDENGNPIAYNLQGQIVDDNYKGVVILNGKKVIRK